jgi:hypothetical protein
MDPEPYDYGEPDMICRDLRDSRCDDMRWTQ